MSGRDLFDYRPEWFENDDEEGSAGDEDEEPWNLDQMRRETREEEERQEDEQMEEMKRAFNNASIND